MQNGNLASFFNSISSEPTLARRAKTFLPASFLHEGSSAQAVAAYDANIQQYPNSNLARFGLYGKFAIQLNNRRDTTGARSLLNQLKTSFPQSVQTEMAELQMSSFRNSSGTNRIGGGMNPISSQSAMPSAQIPTEFGLSQNYPNPFNPSTTIDFALAKDSHVSLKLYDLLGREVKSLVDEPLTAGYHRVTLDGSSLATGVYLYRMNAANFVMSRKLLLVK